jgi:hypothetical protein
MKKAAMEAALDALKTNDEAKKVQAISLLEVEIAKNWQTLTVQEEQALELEARTVDNELSWLNVPRLLKLRDDSIRAKNE